MAKKFVGGYRRKRGFSRAVSFALIAALLMGNLDMNVYAQTGEVTDPEIVTEDTLTVSDGDAETLDDTTPEVTDVPTSDVQVSDGDAADDVQPSEETTVSDGDTEEDVTISDGDAEAEIPALFSLGVSPAAVTVGSEATFVFGSDVTAADVYDAAKMYGFYDLEYNEAAVGCIGAVYYPRVLTKNEAGATYVTDGDGYLKIGSKVWTETETTYNSGVYTYENTSSFDVNTGYGDYTVKVTFVNPTDSAYTAYLESEDITKVSDIVVAAGATVEKEFTAVVVDGTLSLKFLVASSATAEGDAQTQYAYVSKVEYARQADQEVGSGKPTVYIASDSTVQTYDASWYPQTGWGQTLSLFFGDQVEEREADNANYSQCQVYETSNVIVENRAIGGRSSRSFVLEGKLDDLLEDIKAGDYLLIQWGHNDSTYARPNRYVSVEDFDECLQYYIDGAIQRKAIPVLVTPVARYSTNSEGVFVGNFEAYGDVMRQMAAEQEGVGLVDLTARSVALCNSFGVEGAKSLFLIVAAGDYPNGAYAGGANDSTHLQYYGAYKFAQCVAQGIVDAAADGDSFLSDLASKVVMNIPENVAGKIANLTTTTVGSTSVSMKWDAEEDAELYYIYRQVLEAGQTVDDVDFTDAAKYSVSSLPKYTDSACEAGVTYVYAIRGFNEKGLGEFSDKIAATTKTAGMRFDFNTNDSPTMEGWTGVTQSQMYDASVGYGWITAPNNGRYRSGNGNEDSSDMADDFCLGAGEFAVDLPNGDYEVTVYAADLLPGTSTIKPSYTGEGLSIGGISCRQALGSVTSQVRVVDGQLNVVVGGTNMYINGMTITEILKAPSGLVANEANLTDNNGYSFLMGFTGVDEAAGYKIYRKGDTDADFTMIKSFTVEEYSDSATELSCKTVIVDLGQKYEFYMTCYTADGTESARSAIITVDALIDTPVPSVPANVVCVSPTADATELQRSITISWDASTVTDTKYPVIKYNVYRSEKAEGEKGFKEFEKIGETSTTSYTDADSDISTNISYYYKVSAMNAGGASDLSKACKTPVTGKLVAGGRESYTDRALVAINLAGDEGIGSAEGEINVTATDANGNELTKGVYLSWRSFEADLDSNNKLTTTFDVYCNGTVIADDVKVTNLVYEGGNATDTYKVVGSNDSAIGVKTVDTAVWANKYLELKLYCPDDATMPDGSTCSYEANDMSVGDLNGDGDLELIVKWYPSNARDNSGSGYTGKTFLDGYDVNFATGEVSLLWRIDMGVNIRSGAHYTQFQVWDYDGDGKAEIAVKTADGTTTFKSTDGTLNGLTKTGYVGACDTDALPVNVISSAYDYRNGTGYVLDGDEYFSIFNGEDGTKAAEDVAYLPGRGSVAAWGDGYGNRVDRHLSATAYLDGETPFAVFARGYYSRTCLTAYYMKDTDGDNVGDTIATYWEFDTDKAGTQYEAQGNHGLGVNDIDNDGKDEIIYGALTIDHNGTVKYSTGLGHGDAMHISDWVSWNDGLEVMAVHEHDNAAYHVEIHDAQTGEVLMGYYTGKDTGRGVGADIDPTAEGAEWWSIASPTYEGNDEPQWDSTEGEVYSSWSTLNELIKLANTTPASNASIFWDGDLLSEVQDHTFNKTAYAPTGITVTKWNYETEKAENLLYTTEAWSINGTKGNVGLMADILGDWREEIIARTAADKNVVRIYSTTIQTDYVVPCLLENLAYREAVAWQNVGYNQPANLSYLLSKGLVTATLTEGDITYNSAEVLFTAANDGDLFGHEITGYSVYRAVAGGDYELIKTILSDDLKTTVKGGSSDDSGDDTSGNDTATDTTVKADPVYLKFDFGAVATQEGWTAVDAATTFSTELGYGFTSVADNSNKSYAGAIEGDYVDMYNDAVLAWTTDPVGFDVVVPNGTYEVTYYIYNGSGHVYNLVTAEDVSFSDVRRGATDKQATYETKTVEVTDGVLNIVNTGSKSGYKGLYFTGIEIKDTTYDAWLAEKEAANNTTNDVPKTQIVWETLASEDFEDGASSFALIASGNSAYEYLEADTSTVNNNTSSYVYGVGSRAGGDTATQWSGLGVEENVTVTFDVKMDACNQGKSSNFALLGAADKSNWLTSTSQILTICGSASGNGYWGSITVNGIDITEKANVSNGQSNGESSGKGGLLRDTTGWMKVSAALDFENQQVALTMTRISDGSTIYEGTVAFVNEVSKLDSIYMAAAKVYGGVFVDNITIAKSKEVPVEDTTTDDTTTDDTTGDNTATGEVVYTFTDTGLSQNTEYSYKIAAVVDGKASHMSRALTVKTAVNIASVNAIDTLTLVAGTPLADGKTVEDLLPTTVKVTDVEGNVMDADATWDASAVDINTVGTYTVKATIKGYDKAVEAIVEVVANEVKEVVPFEDITIIEGTSVTLPEKATVSYTNTTTKDTAVTWDTADLNTDKVGEYTVTGTLNGFDNTVTVKVIVVADYIVSLANAYVEFELGTAASKVSSVLPKTVTATWASGKTSEAAVTWTVGTIDSATVGAVAEYTGTISKFDGNATVQVTVVYPVVKRFDFGINTGTITEGWTPVTVNPKGGTKTIAEFGSEYTAEKGYGFEDGTAVFEGREEPFTQYGVLPKNVYVDYALAAGNTFLVDVENGRYLVEVISTCGIGKTDVFTSIEGTAFTLGNGGSTGNGAYRVGGVEVDVEDGQLTVAFTSGLTRVGGIIVRAIDVADADVPGTDVPGTDSGSDDSSDNDDNNDSSTDDNTGDDSQTGDGSDGNDPTDDNSGSDSDDSQTEGGADEPTVEQESKLETIIHKVVDSAATILSTILSSNDAEEIKEVINTVITDLVEALKTSLADTGIEVANAKPAQIQELANVEEQILQMQPELVSVEAPEGVHIANAVFNSKDGKPVQMLVQQPEDEAKEQRKAQIEKALPVKMTMGKDAQIYEINMFVDGEKSQPNVPLQLTFPRPENVEDLVVMHILDDETGEYEFLEYELTEESVIATTGSLSAFVVMNLVEETVVADAEDKAPQAVTDSVVDGAVAIASGETPAMNVFVIVAIAIALVAGLAAVCVFFRKKEEQ